MALSKKQVLAEIQEAEKGVRRRVDAARILDHLDRAKKGVWELREPAPPEPEPPASTFAPDLFYGDKLSKYRTVNVVPGHVYETPDPLGIYGTVLRFDTHDEDTMDRQGAANPRNEIMCPREIIEPGWEGWISGGFLLPKGLDFNGFFGQIQGPWGPPWSGSPWFSLKTEANGDLRWQRNATYGYDVPCSKHRAPFLGVWTRYLLHLRYAKEGWIELWVNGEPVSFFKDTYVTSNPRKIQPTTRLAMETYDAASTTGPWDFCLQSYRKHNVDRGVITTHHLPLAIGTERELVEYR